MAPPAVEKHPDPKAMYLCIEGYAAVEGTYRTGDRLRGSHETVKEHPLFWILDGASTDEIHEARQARFVAIRD